MVFRSGPSCVKRPKPSGPPSGSPDQSRNHACNTGNLSGKLLPVCCRHLGKWWKSTGPASDSRNPSINHVGDTGNPSRTALPVCCHHGGNSQNRLDQPQIGGIHRQSISASHHYTIALTNPCYSWSVRLAKILSAHRQRSRPRSVNSRPLSSPTSGRLTSSISGPLTSLRGVSNRI